MAANQRLQKVLDYMEMNLNENISLQNLCSVAGYSVPQFYRLFKQLTGDTVGEYLLRRKLSEAAIELTQTRKSVSEIAFKYGFQSHDVFTRAFSRVYGVTPKQYRNSDVEVQPIKRLEIQEHHNIKDESQMSFSIISTNEIKVVGMECLASKWDSDGAIGELWCSFLRRLSSIGGITKPAKFYGICEAEGTYDEHFVYMAAVGVDDVCNVPEGMKVRVIRPQKFFCARVPQKITTPDAYTCAINYAKSLGYVVEWYDELEVYEESFHDPDINQFELLIPIK